MDTIHFIKIIYDIFLLILLLLMFVCMKYFVDPFKTGFYCDDFSINMPFKTSTVTNTVLIIISVPVPFVFMVITEIFRTIHMKYKHAKLSLHNKYRVLFIRGKIIEFQEQIGNTFINFGAFLFGLLCTLNLTLIGKKTIGRLRPNFLDVCKPLENPYITYCNTHLTGKTFLIPGDHFQCGTINVDDVNESRKSFPSGHASTSFYAMIFLILYIHRFWNKKNLGFVPQFFQFVLFAVAWFISLSRVMDNKHHPTDVLAGGALGTLVASFTFYYLNLFYRRYNFRSKYDSATNSLEFKNLQLSEEQIDQKKSYGIKTV